MHTLVYIYILFKNIHYNDSVLDFINNKVFFDYFFLPKTNKNNKQNKKNKNFLYFKYFNLINKIIL